MTEPARSRSADLRGFGKLAFEAVVGLASLVEAMHDTIARAPGPLGAAPEGRTRGITGLVYGSVRGVTKLVGVVVDATLARLAPLLGNAMPSPRREAVLAALNGVLGDHLEATGNPLALPMQLRWNGRPLDARRDVLATMRGKPKGRLVLLVHGLCLSDLSWRREGHDHGAALARDLGLTPVYLRYNTGLHVSANGRALSQRLEALASSWPVPLEEIAFVGHSMGGLIIRSALHYGAQAGHGWPRRVRRVVFLGAPHHGTVLERGGNLVDAFLGVSPYTAPLARLGRIRSAGITDLRHGNVLDEDWAGRDRFARGGDRRRPAPLPRGVAFHGIAATTAKTAAGLAGRLVGDGLVPVASALGRHKDPERTLHVPEARQWIATGTGHMELLSRPEVYARIRAWLGGEPG
jgi:PGAP1-like protein